MLINILEKNMRKKCLYIVVFLAVIVMCIWYFSTNYQPKHGVNISPEVIEQPQSLLKILANKGANATLKNNVKSYNKVANIPALVIAPAFKAISVDDLLDPKDRTLRSKVMLIRHNKLLTNIYDIHTIQQQNIPIESISVVNLQAWVQALISDLLINNASFQQQDITEAIINNGTFDPSILPESNQLSDAISKGYLDKVKQLADEVAVLTDLPEDHTKKQTALYQIASLSIYAKKQSNVFLLTKMKSYFKGGQYNLKQKIDFAQALANTRDSKLISSITQYFEYALTLPEYQKQQQNINNFIESLPKG
jgi:hypothetical protein